MGRLKVLCKKGIKIIVVALVVLFVWDLSGVVPFERTVKVNKAVLTESGILINFSTTWGNPATSFFCGVSPDKGKHYTESNLIHGYGSLEMVAFNKNDMTVEIGFFEKGKKDYFKEELIDMFGKYDTIYCKLVQITTMNLESEEFVIKTKDIVR